MKIHAFSLVGIFFLLTSLSFAQNVNQKFSDDDFRMQEWFLKSQGQQTYPAIDSNFTVLGRWAWGHCRAIAMSGNYALVGQGSMYQVFDVTDPYKPSIVYDTIMPGGVMDIKIKDTLLFIILGGTVLICDGRQLYPLVELGRCVINGAYVLDDMSVSDSLLFLTGKPFGIMVYNISDLAHPTFRAFGGIYWFFPSSIASKGEYIYYGPLGPGFGLIVYRYIPDSAFWGEKRLYIGGNATAIHLRDTLLFVGNTYGQLFIFSITDPWTPRTLDSIDLNSRIYEITAKGNNIYCSTLDSGIVVINIANPSDPTIVNKSVGQRRAEKLASSDSVLGMAEYKGFAIFKIGGEDNIEYTSYFPTGGSYYDIEMKGNIGYITTDVVGLWIVDFSNPAHPKPLDSFLPSKSSWDVELTDHLACILSDSLIIAEIEESGLLRYLSAIDYKVGGGSIAVQDTLVFIGADSTVDIISIADPSHPHLLSTWRMEGLETKVSVSGNLLAVTTRIFNAGFRLLDISEPSTPRELCFLPMDAIGVLLDDTLAFVGGPTFKIFNIKNPSSPVILANTNISCGSGVKFVREGKFVYKTGDYFGTIDMSDPAQPIEVANLLWYTWTYGIAINHDTIGVATSNAGIWILKNNIVTSMIEEPMNIPYSLSLGNNYPNPFNSTTIIKYEVPDYYLVNLKVFDVLGKEIATLVNEVKSRGKYLIAWTASKTASGVYYLRLTAGNNTIIKKMLFIK